MISPYYPIITIWCGWFGGLVVDGWMTVGHSQGETAGMCSVSCRICRLAQVTGKKLKGEEATHLEGDGNYPDRVHQKLIA